MIMDVEAGTFLMTSRPSLSVPIWQRTWEESWSYCQTLGPKWTLPTMLSHRKARIVHSIQTTPNEDIWIAYRRTRDGTFTWTDFSPTGYAPWAIGSEPAVGVGSCTRSRATIAAGTAQWYTTDCSSTTLRETICEIGEWPAAGVRSFTLSLMELATNFTINPLIPSSILPTATGQRAVYGATVQVSPKDCSQSDALYLGSSQSGVSVTLRTQCTLQLTGNASDTVYTRLLGSVILSAFATQRPTVGVSYILWSNPSAVDLFVQPHSTISGSLRVMSQVMGSFAWNQNTYSPTALNAVQICQSLGSYFPSEPLDASTISMTQAVVTSRGRSLGSTLIGFVKISGQWTAGRDPLTPLTLTNWLDNEPAAGTDCATITASGLWAGTACTTRQQFVLCETAVPPVASSLAGTATVSFPPLPPNVTLPRDTTEMTLQWTNLSATTQITRPFLGHPKILSLPPIRNLYGITFQTAVRQCLNTTLNNDGLFGWQPPSNGLNGLTWEFSPCHGALSGEAAGAVYMDTAQWVEYAVPRSAPLRRLTLTFIVCVDGRMRGLSWHIDTVRGFAALPQTPLQFSDPFLSAPRFIDAFSICPAVSAAGYLPTITTPEEDEVFKITSRRYLTSASSVVLLGALRNQNGAPYSWLTAEPAFYENYASGEPSNSANMMLSLDQNGNWKDVTATATTSIPYLCELQNIEDTIGVVQLNYSVPGSLSTAADLVLINIASGLSAASWDQDVIVYGATLLSSVLTARSQDRFDFPYLLGDISRAWITTFQPSPVYALLAGTAKIQHFNAVLQNAVFMGLRSPGRTQVKIGWLYWVKPEHSGMVMNLEAGYGVGLLRVPVQATSWQGSSTFRRSNTICALSAMKFHELADVSQQRMAQQAHNLMLTDDGEEVLVGVQLSGGVWIGVESGAAPSYTDWFPNEATKSASGTQGVFLTDDGPWRTLNGGSIRRPVLCSTSLTAARYGSATMDGNATTVPSPTLLRVWTTDLTTYRIGFNPDSTNGATSNRIFQASDLTALSSNPVPAYGATIQLNPLQCRDTQDTLSIAPSALSAITGLPTSFTTVIFSTKVCALQIDVGHPSNNPVDPLPSTTMRNILLNVTFTSNATAGRTQLQFAWILWVHPDLDSVLFDFENRLVLLGSTLRFTSLRYQGAGLLAELSYGDVARLCRRYGPTALLPAMLSDAKELLLSEGFLRPVFGRPISALTQLFVRFSTDYSNWPYWAEPRNSKSVATAPWAPGHPPPAASMPTATESGIVACGLVKLDSSTNRSRLQYTSCVTTFVDVFVCEVPVASYELAGTVTYLRRLNETRSELRVRINPALSLPAAGVYYAFSVLSTLQDCDPSNDMMQVESGHDAISVVRLTPCTLVMSGLGSGSDYNTLLSNLYWYGPAKSTRSSIRLGFIVRDTPYLPDLIYYPQTSKAYTTIHWNSISTQMPIGTAIFHINTFCGLVGGSAGFAPVQLSSEIDNNGALESMIAAYPTRQPTDAALNVYYNGTGALWRWLGTTALFPLASFMKWAPGKGVSGSRGVLTSTGLWVERSTSTDSFFMCETTSWPSTLRATAIVSISIASVSIPFTTQRKLPTPLVPFNPLSATDLANVQSTLAVHSSAIRLVLQHCNPRIDVLFFNRSAPSCLAIEQSAGVLMVQNQNDCSVSFYGVATAGTHKQLLQCVGYQTANAVVMQLSFSWQFITQVALSGLKVAREEVSRTTYTTMILPSSSAKLSADADRVCRNIGPGWSLPVINTIEESTAILQLLSDPQTLSWTGGVRTPKVPIALVFNQSKPAWSPTGSWLKVHLFADSGPLNILNECFYMQTMDGKWVDCPCTTTIFELAVCQGPPIQHRGIVTLALSKDALAVPPENEYTNIKAGLDDDPLTQNKLVYGGVLHVSLRDLKPTDRLIPTASDDRLILIRATSFLLQFFGDVPISALNEVLGGAVFQSFNMDRSVLRFGYLYYSDPFARDQYLDLSMHPAGSTIWTVYKGLQANTWTGLSLTGICSSLGKFNASASTAAQAQEQKAVIQVKSTFLGNKPGTGYFNYFKDIQSQFGYSCGSCAACVTLYVHGTWLPVSCTQAQDAVLCGESGVSGFGFPTAFLAPAPSRAELNRRLAPRLDTFNSTGFVPKPFQDLTWGALTNSTVVFGVTMQLAQEQCKRTTLLSLPAIQPPSNSSAFEIPFYSIPRTMWHAYFNVTLDPFHPALAGKIIDRPRQGQSCVLFVQGTDSVENYRVIVDAVTFRTSERRRGSLNFIATIWVDPRIVNMTTDFPTRSVTGILLNPIQKNWLFSFLQCSALGPTWTLPSLRTQEESWILSWQDRTVDRAPLGAMRTPPGAYSWTDGETFVYLNWEGSGAPSTTTKACSAFNTTTGLWVDVDCASDYFFTDISCKSSTHDTVFLASFSLPAVLNLTTSNGSSVIPSYVLNPLWRASQLPSVGSLGLPSYGMTLLSQLDVCDPTDRFGVALGDSFIAVSHSLPCHMWFVGTANVSSYVRLLNTTTWSTLRTPSAILFGYVMWTDRRLNYILFNRRTLKTFATIPTNVLYEATTGYPYQIAAPQCVASGGSLFAPTNPTDLLESFRTLVILSERDSTLKPLIGIFRDKTNGNQYTYTAGGLVSSGYLPFKGGTSTARDCLLADPAGFFEPTRCAQVQPGILCSLTVSLPLIYPPLSRTASLTLTPTVSRSTSTSFSDSLSVTDTFTEELSLTRSGSKYTPSSTLSASLSGTVTVSARSPSLSCSTTMSSSASDSLTEELTPSKSVTVNRISRTYTLVPTDTASLPPTLTDTFSFSLTDSTSDSLTVSDGSFTKSKSEELSLTRTKSPPPTLSQSPTTSFTVSQSQTPPPTRTATPTITPPPTATKTFSRSSTDTEERSLTMSDSLTDTEEGSLTRTVSPPPTETQTPSISLELTKSHTLPPTRTHTLTRTQPMSMSHSLMLSDSLTESFTEEPSGTDSMSTTLTATWSDSLSLRNTLTASMVLTESSSILVTPSKSRFTYSFSEEESRSESFPSQSLTRTITPPPTPTVTITSTNSIHPTETLSISLLETGKLFVYDLDMNRTGAAIQSGFPRAQLQLHFRVEMDSWDCEHLNYTHIAITTDPSDNVFGFRNRLRYIFNNNSISFCNRTDLVVEMQRDQNFEDYFDTTFYVDFVGATIRKIPPQPSPTSFTIKKIEIPNDISSAIAANNVASRASVAGALGGGASATSAQALAIIGLISCARPSLQEATKGAKQSMVPLPLSDNYQGWILGNGLLLGAVSLVHFPAVVIIREASRCTWHEARERAKFPSLSFTVMTILHQGIAFSAFKLLQTWSTGADLALGVIGTIYSIGTPIGLWVWAVRFLKTRWIRFSIFDGRPIWQTWILPTGFFLPEQYVGAIGELEKKPELIIPYLQMTVVALIGSFSTSTTPQCIAQYSCAATWFFLFAIYVIVRRPYRSFYHNISQALMYLILSLVCIGGAVSQVQRRTGEEMVSYLLLIQSSFAMALTVIGLILTIAEIVLFRSKQMSKLTASAVSDLIDDLEKKKSSLRKNSSLQRKGSTFSATSDGTSVPDGTVTLSRTMSRQLSFDEKILLDAKAGKYDAPKPIAIAPPVAAVPVTLDPDVEILDENGNSILPKREGEKNGNEREDEFHSSEDELERTMEPPAVPGDAQEGSDCDVYADLSGDSHRSPSPGVNGGGYQRSTGQVRDEFSIEVRPSTERDSNGGQRSAKKKKRPVKNPTSAGPQLTEQERILLEISAKHQGLRIPFGFLGDDDPMSLLRQPGGRISDGDINQNYPPPPPVPERERRAMHFWFHDEAHNNASRQEGGAPPSFDGRPQPMGHLLTPPAPADTSNEAMRRAADPHIPSLSRLQQHRVLSEDIQQAAVLPPTPSNVLPPATGSSPFDPPKEEEAKSSVRSFVDSILGPRLGSGSSPPGNPRSTAATAGGVLTPSPSSPPRPLGSIPSAIQTPLGVSATPFSGLPAAGSLTVVEQERNRMRYAEEQRLKMEELVRLQLEAEAETMMKREAATRELLDSVLGPSPAATATQGPTKGSQGKGGAGGGKTTQATPSAILVPPVPQTSTRPPPRAEAQPSASAQRALWELL
jgi:hypothetical protein